MKINLTKSRLAEGSVLEVAQIDTSNILYLAGLMTGGWMLGQNEMMGVYYLAGLPISVLSAWKLAK